MFKFIAFLILFSLCSLHAEQITLKEKVLSMAVSMTILENDQEIGTAKDTIISLTPTIEIDFKGNSYQGSNQLLSWGTTTVLTRDQQPYATVKKQVIESWFSPASNRFIILDANQEEIGRSSKDWRLVDTKITFKDSHGKSAVIHRHAKLIGPDTWTIYREDGCLITMPILIVCATLKTMADKE